GAAQGNVAIVSIYDMFWHGACDNWKVTMRCTHELGHTLGLSHCGREACVMYPIPQSVRLCSACRKNIATHESQKSDGGKRSCAIDCVGFFVLEASFMLLLIEQGLVMALDRAREAIRPAGIEHRKKYLWTSYIQQIRMVKRLFLKSRSCRQDYPRVDIRVFNHQATAQGKADFESSVLYQSAFAVVSGFDLNIMDKFLISMIAAEKIKNSWDAFISSIDRNGSLKTDPGVVTVTIEPSGPEDQDGLAIRTRDTGAGVHAQKSESKRGDPRYFGGFGRGFRNNRFFYFTQFMRMGFPSSFDWDNVIDAPPVFSGTDTEVIVAVPFRKHGARRMEKRSFREAVRASHKAYQAFNAAQEPDDVTRHYDGGIDANPYRNAAATLDRLPSAICHRLVVDLLMKLNEFAEKGQLGEERIRAREAFIGFLHFQDSAGVRDDSSSRIRAVAARGLGRIGDPVAVPYLKEALADKSCHVRFKAVDALGRIATVDAFAVLETVAADAQESAIIKARAESWLKSKNLSLSEKAQRTDGGKKQLSLSERQQLLISKAYSLIKAYVAEEGLGDTVAGDIQEIIALLDTRPQDEDIWENAAIVVALLRQLRHEGEEKQKVLEAFLVTRLGKEFEAKLGTFMIDFEHGVAGHKKQLQDRRAMALFWVPALILNFSFLTAIHVNRMIEAMAKIQGKDSRTVRVLNLGCNLMHPLAQRGLGRKGYTFIGYDMDERVAWLNEKFSRVAGVGRREYKTGIAANIQLPDNSVDFMVVGFSELDIMEARRILKPDGILIMTPHDFGHFQVVYEGLLRKSGFQIIETGYSVPIHHTYVISRKPLHVKEGLLFGYPGLVENPELTVEKVERTYSRDVKKTVFIFLAAIWFPVAGFLTYYHINPFLALPLFIPIFLLLNRVPRVDGARLKRRLEELNQLSDGGVRIITRTVAQGSQRHAVALGIIGSISDNENMLDAIAAAVNRFHRRHAYWGDGLCKVNARLLAYALGEVLGSDVRFHVLRGESLDPRNPLKASIGEPMFKHNEHEMTYFAVSGLHIVVDVSAAMYMYRQGKVDALVIAAAGWDDLRGLAHTTFGSNSIDDWKISDTLADGRFETPYHQIYVNGWRNLERSCDKLFARRASNRQATLDDFKDGGSKSRVILRDYEPARNMRRAIRQGRKIQEYVTLSEELEYRGFEPRQGAVYVDIGAGRGAGSVYLAKRLGFKTEHMVIIDAKDYRQEKYARFFYGDALESLRMMEDNHADLVTFVTSFGVILFGDPPVRQMMVRPEALLQESARILKPSGVLAIHDFLADLTRKGVDIADLGARCGLTVQSRSVFIEVFPYELTIFEKEPHGSGRARMDGGKKISRLFANKYDASKGRPSHAIPILLSWERLKKCMAGDPDLCSVNLFNAQLVAASINHIDSGFISNLENIVSNNSVFQFYA
ncbi:MAG TPA: HEAT repeat domain-containing protein, partial [Candidatus Omnitrophota bacterium]|nr:HEAT repeat domain-containing protein [Candidatus Omnitrophota bacterium]